MGENRMKKIILILMIMASNAFGTNITYRFTYGAQWLDDSLEFTTFYKDGSAYDSISFNAVGTDHIDSAAVYPDTCPILIKIRGWIDGEVWYSTINIDLSNKHDTAAFARAGWDNNVIGEVNRTVGNVTALATGAIDSGDFGSTYWAAMQNDSAANARANWDNDIVAEVNRTVGTATSVTGLATGAIDSSDLASTYWAAMQNDSAANARYIWNLPFATAWVAGSMGDSMNNSSYVQGPAVTAWNSTQRDSVLQTIADAGKLGRIIDSLNAILDSLQSQDNWVGKEVTINTEVGNIDGWNPITDNDSLIGDQSTNTATAIVDTAAIGRSVWDFDIVDSTGRIVVVRPINTQGDTLARQKDSAIMQGQAAGITVAAVIDSMIKQGFVTYSLGQDSTLLLKRVAISGANGVSGSVNIVNTSTTSPVGIKVDVSSANAAGRAVELFGSAASWGLLAQAGNNNSLYPTMAIKYADGSAGKLYSIQDSKIDSIYDSIKAANGWVATQANQQTIVINIAQNKDSIQAIIDSLNILAATLASMGDSIKKTLDSLYALAPVVMRKTDSAFLDISSNLGYADSIAAHIRTSGLTQDVIDRILAMAVADTSNNSLLAQLVRDGASGGYGADTAAIIQAILHILVSDTVPGSWAAKILSSQHCDSGYNYTIPNSGAPDLCTVFLIYFRGATAVQNATLTIRNDNVATDTTTGLLIGPYMKTAQSDTAGLVVIIDVPKTYLFNDSTLGLYDISLSYGGRVIVSWQDVFIPNQDTLRMTVQ